MFRQLYLKNFPPFAEQTIAFPPLASANLAETHIFTGINGTGKTRLLSVLAAYLGAPKHLEQRLDPAGKKMEGVLSDRDEELKNISRLNVKHIGSFSLAIPPTALSPYEISSFASFLGNIPAFAYNGTAYLQDDKITLMAPTVSLTREAALSFLRPPDQSQQLLQGIANLKINAAVDALNHKETGEATQNIHLMSLIETAISQITGEPFFFDIDSYGEAKLSVRWGAKKAKLCFSHLPDGLRSIIGWLVHAIVMLNAELQGKSDPTNTPCIFLLDEIESHLHPKWQRKILPAFQQLFPKAQIFVATHSPFVISSINHGWIHQLKTVENGDVRAKKPIPASPGNSYLSVLQDIMGLDEYESYDSETEKLLKDFRESCDQAHAGNDSAFNEAEGLAEKIGSRGTELQVIVGAEMAQLRRYLKK